MTILIEIPTKDRDSTLGRCLAALLNQSYQDFDILILNDGDQKVGKTKTTEYLLGELRRSHAVYVIPGSKISQAHNHNIALYDPRFREYAHILRLDDDVLLDRQAIEFMFESIEHFSAVSGLWFEMEWKDETFHDRAVMSWAPEDDLETRGLVGPISSNWQQRMYHPTNEPYYVEHIYGSCLYNAREMRLAGGWPEVYSKGVAHGEETDGTYHLWLSGGDMIIDPRVTGQHLKSPGGIRSHKTLGRARVLDSIKWQNRLPEISHINFKPTVAIWCQHAYDIGGAQRLFYHTISLLQSSFGLDVVPVFTGPHFTPEECQETFGFTYEELPQLEEYDVCIVMAHEPFYPVEAKHYILYNFFPEKKWKHPLEENDLILTVSKFTAEWVGRRWGKKAHHLYPPVIPIEQVDVEKENVILCVSRGDPNKAPLWLMQRFIEMDLEDWEFHFVMATTSGVYTEYEEQMRAFVQEHDNIHIFEDVSHGELCDYYRRSKILWSANGLYGDKNPQHSEHFGYTPIEAWSAGCMPIVFDRGGHGETVADEYRWSTSGQLRSITEYVVSTFDAGWISAGPVDVARYSVTEYAWRWEQWIRRVNAMALELEPIERIEVASRKIRVAAISDSPYLPEYDIGLTTGFGTVVGQIYRRIIAQDDMDLFIFGFMDPKYPRNVKELPFHFFPSPLGDMQGRGDKTLPAFLAWAQPDVVFELYDPGNMMGHVKTLRMVGYDGPIVAYFPIEGEPISKATYNLVQSVDFPVTYCKAGVESIKRVLPDVDVGYTYHGADHAPFEPLADDERDHLRRLVGWDDKFILINVGANKRVKQQPYLIEALRILLEQGHDDVYLYLHTRMFDNHVMNGWTLDWIRDSLSLAHDMEELRSHILAPMDFDKWHGPSYKYQDSLEAWRMTTAPTAQMRGAIFNAMDMITRYQLADLYVDASSAEGWGLGPLEAIACGTPTISVADKHVRSEVHSKYCNMMLKPVHWTTWHTSARLQLVSPTDIAESILEIKDDYGTEKSFALEMSKAVLTDLPWEDTAMYFVDLIRRAHEQASK